MKCPLCSVDLVMSERQGIEIDYCPKCRGVWLDRGELDKIIERSTSEMPPSQPQPRADNNIDRHEKHHDGHHEKRHGKGHSYQKRSFLLDLFD